MTKRTPIRFIINPTSGPKSRVDVPACIQKHLDLAFFEHEIVFTEYAGHATQLAQEAAAAACKIVVAVGGDGTVNEVAQGLLYTDTALGILPKGSGNGLARHLEVPMKIEGALQVLNQGHIRTIDSGHINKHPFFTTAGIGFDAYISSVFAGNKKRGLQTYLELVLKEVLTYKHQTVKASINGNELDTDCYVMAFANAAQYGNNAYVAPMADIQDGLLDVCLVRQMDLIKALHLSYSMLTRQLANEDSAEYFQTKHVQVKTEEPMLFHADGEFKGKSTSFEVHVEPQSLKVVTPL
ncbi:YegS/Rv2252/BmrU family lipid kinase [Pontibacter ummariensis]|uniref:Lipid kinase, YegS/Rv2252/BmrU family n=1 Tax=Pontibacter ummariensis TaxID=1610492 RepID=A0A239KRF8_9BACT|nr:diacylglycerol kinase family protein [Pontibacter ummariensis]PRY05384.1 YegS/Rv2252/BmrU family lipid kinase [Pontibacter ummariensis]SNT20258.1 lipid kinase, YegS/Rv2252/BmrU family [Pontibacter ummariensis]